MHVIPGRDRADLRQHRGDLGSRHADVLGEDRSEPLQGRVGQPPGLEQRLCLHVVGRLLHPRRAHVGHGRGDRVRLGRAGVPRRVHPGQQQGGGVRADAEVLPVLHRLQAEPVQQLEHGRGQVAERPDDRARNPGWRGPQPQGHLGHHAKCALGSDEEPDHVEPGHALGGAPSQAYHVAVGDGATHDGAQAQDVIPGDAVLQAAQAARVGGHVAADRRPRSAGRIRRVPQSVFGDGGLDVVVDRARLDDADQVVRVDLQDLVHPGQVKDDTAADRIGAAGQPGTRAARHDGNPQPGAAADDVLDLGF